MARTLGDVARAMLAAAAERPDTARNLAVRAHVGCRLARYTASRMVARGELVAMPGTRPALLAAAEQPAPTAAPAAADELHQFFFFPGVR